MNTQLSPNDISILGIGNLYRGDDGAGLRVLDLLKINIPKGIKLYAGAGDEAAFMDLWHKTKRSFVVDAVQSGQKSGQKPGTIFRLSCADLEKLDTSALCFRCSTHSFDLRNCVELAKTIGSFPKDLQLVIYGIEAQSFCFGTELTEPMSAAIHNVAKQIEFEIVELLR